MASSRADVPARAPRVLLCVSGSIAAYKTADVVSALRKRGVEVRCLLTASAREFVTPLVLETLSGHPVERDLFGPGISGTEHIRLARWPDLVAFAPASAHLLARLALGLADDLVTTVALATEAPWLVAPAMNTVMWRAEATRGHVATLATRGARFVEPDEGVLACGEEGPGKLAAPERIVEAIEAALAAASRPSRSLEGVRVLITAGPTTSAIDAVRYLTNPSTGRMGAALAEEALARGAEVRYVLGVDKGVVRPVAPRGAEARLALREVRTAEEMCEAALAELPGVDGVVATAAVLDYRVERSETAKLRRGTEAVELRLVPSVDVLARLREAARPGQWFLGFAAETEDAERRGLEKLEKKGLDFLFANRVARLDERNLDTGFGVETNGGWLLRRGAEPVALATRGKRELARELWDRVCPS
jgi:phosphopantothenoylcysteine decarboxylase/phosphopantothenate--cysteine ligase